LEDCCARNVRRRLKATPKKKEKIEGKKKKLNKVKIKSDQSTLQVLKREKERIYLAHKTWLRFPP
jgi:hypothetical protein